jgi:hypothetical protein
VELLGSKQCLTMLFKGLVTIAFLWITTAAFFWEDKVVTEMVALPIGALFAFTSVRANLPGAPAGFGTLTFQLPARSLKLMSSLPRRHCRPVLSPPHH